MRFYPFPLAAVIALTIAIPSHAAEKPRAAQTNQAKKIWTNDDMDQLRAQGLICTFSLEQPPTAQPEQPQFTAKTEDPTWYAKQAAILQAELDRREAALREARANLAQAAKGITEAGIALDKSNPGVTPEAGIAALETQVREIQIQMDELNELARQNNISPGVLRG